MKLYSGELRMNLIEKMIRAAKLEAEFYEEVEKDE